MSEKFCSYCAITNCEKCILLNKSCHDIDNKSICIPHSKGNRSIEINTNRVLISPTILSKAEQRNKIYKSNINLEINFHNKTFNSFYNEFNNTARFFEIFDSNDTEIYTSILFVLI